MFEPGLNETTCKEVMMTRFLIHNARPVLYATILCLVLSHGIALAAPVFLFDFDGDIAGLEPPNPSISNGIMATFSSGFIVFPTTPLLLTLTGNALFQTSSPTLDIQFSQDIQYVQLVFGSTGPGDLTLTAFDSLSNVVGQSSATGNILPGGTIPEGSIFFGGTAFRSVALNFSNPDATFAVDNLTNAPEPATICLFGLATIALGCSRKLLSRP